MTVKLVVMYTQPGDASAFDEHYFGAHVKLVARLPGLQRTETGRVVKALDGGEQTNEKQLHERAKEARATLEPEPPGPASAPAAPPEPWLVTADDELALV
jgi:uncharacterized protein (TIGR02118 family)